MHVISDITSITSLGVNVFLIHTPTYLSQAPVHTHKPNCVGTKSVSHNANKKQNVFFLENQTVPCVLLT